MMSKSLSLLLVVAPITVAALRMAPPRMSMAQEGAWKSAWLYEQQLLHYKTGGKTHERGMDHPSTNWVYGPGQVAPTAGVAPSSPATAEEGAWKSAWEYEQQLLHYKTGGKTHERGMDHPSTNWVYGPGQVTPTQAAPEPSTTAEEGAWVKSWEYEQQLLHYKHGGKTHERGMLHPSTNWAL